MILIAAKKTVLWLEVILLLSYLALLLVLWLQNPAIVNENGMMENLQALSLAAGGLVSFVGLLLPGRHYPRIVYYVLTILFLTLFLREVDVDRLDLPGILVTLGSGAGRNLLLAGAVLLALVLFVKEYRTLAPIAVALLRHRHCYPFYLGVVLYLGGDVFEKHWLPLARPTNLFLEELCENAATAFFLWGVIGLVWGKRLDQEAT